MTKRGNWLCQSTLTSNNKEPCNIHLPQMHIMKQRNLFITSSIIAICTIAIGILFYTLIDNNSESVNTSSSQTNNDEIKEDSISNEGENSNSNDGSRRGDELARYSLKTDTNNAIINLDKVLSGGPSKDRIPSIDDPKFTSIKDVSSNVKDDTLGILYEGDSTVRYYPYNILVWHEIVNDTVDGIPINISFCPLCGSAIGYSRVVDGETLEFGVSGLLYESNLLMYDRKTESLWSQIEGRAVVGDYTGTELDLVDIEILEFNQIKEEYPDAEVLSEDTGYSRDYDQYPYGDYEENDEFFFPVTYKGEGLPSKEIVYAVRYNDTPVAFVLDKLRKEGNVTMSLENGSKINAEFIDEKVVVKDQEGNILPGFYTMWFSWANHNLPEGVNEESDGEVWGL